MLNWRAQSGLQNVMNRVAGVPVFLHGKMSEELKRRVLEQDWQYWRIDEDVCAVRVLGEPSVNFLLDAQKALGIKRTHEEDKSCARCGIVNANPRKCAFCLRTYYCDAVCQRAHWTEHNGFCEQPTPGVLNVWALALPRYPTMNAVAGMCAGEASRWPSTGYMSLLIASRTRFREVFGERSEERTILELAARGRPSQLRLNVTFPK
jgi:hypothetical protein